MILQVHDELNFSVPDGKVDAQYDRTVLGSTTPKFYYAFHPSFLEFLALHDDK